MRRIKSWLLIAGILPMLGSGALASPRSPVAANGDFDSAPLRRDIYEKLWLKDYQTTDASEPRLSLLDEGKAAAFLDATSRNWANQNGCGTCHTNIPYLIARPMMSRTEEGERTMGLVRAKMVEAYRSDASAPLRSFFVGPSAASLAVNDFLTTGIMSAEAKELFHAAWALQSPDGNWRYPLADMLPFLERERRYVAYFVALGVGYLPEEYKRSPESKLGLTRLRLFIRRNMPDKPHDKAIVLWAAARSSYLLTTAEKNSYQTELLAMQKSDGGWTLPSLGSWPRHDGAPNDPDGPSDGYATGLVTTALCSSGLGARDPGIARSIDWIKRNQRESGRWYTRSTYSEEFKGYIANMATAYAIIALKTCKPPEPASEGG